MYFMGGLPARFDGIQTHPVGKVQIHKPFHLISSVAFPFSRCRGCACCAAGQFDEDHPGSSVRVSSIFLKFRLLRAVGIHYVADLGQSINDPGHFRPNSCCTSSSVISVSSTASWSRAQNGARTQVPISSHRSGHGGSGGGYRAPLLLRRMVFMGFCRHFERIAEQLFIARVSAWI